MQITLPIVLIKDFRIFLTENPISIFEQEKDGYESMVITTEDMETYKCMIPPPPAEKTQKESDTTNLCK